MSRAITPPVGPVAEDRQALARSFSERVAASVTLTIAGTSYAFAGGDVPYVELRLLCYGFSGAVEVLVHDDAAHGGSFEDGLLTAFLADDLVQIAVALDFVHESAEASASLQPVRVNGIVTHKTMEEMLLRHSLEQPILVRRYRFELADAASVLWTQHHPVELYTQKTLQAVIAAHTGESIAFTYDWGELTETRPQWFVHLPPERGVSFYDFVIWIADTRGGVFSYDYGQEKYKLAGIKDEPSTPATLFGDDVESAEIIVPSPPRHVVVVADSYADGPRSETIEHAQAVAGIQHTHPIRTPVAQDVDDAVTLERTRLRLPKYEAELMFGRSPGVDVVPGSWLGLAAANRWNEKSALVTPTWRVRETWICAAAAAGLVDHDRQRPSTVYTVQLRVRLEQGDDPRITLPTYRVPHYPAYVEGKIVSEKGEAGEKTFHTYRNETTSLDEYTVKVPLYADQTITVPFEPGQGSGNVFVPSYRDERVLLALELERARIERLLVWREGAALSMDVQGEQILFGKSGASHTSIHHVYEDEQPIFEVERIHGDDTSLIRLREGAAFVQVQEQKDGEAAAGTLVCTLELANSGGVTLKVTNGDDSIVQTVTMNGTKMRFEVAGSSDTSSIELEADKISIETKDLSIKARNTIVVEADGTASHSAKRTTTITSEEADVSITAKTKAKVAGTDVEVTADSGVSVSGMTVKATGSQSIALSGTTEAKLSGATVKLAADATLTAESSGMATLGGNMTTIKGSLITAG